MARGWETIRDLKSYTGWSPRRIGGEDSDDSFVEGPRWTFSESAGGDLGTLRLAKADFAKAMDTYLAGNLWTDAAYVAERILTTDELRAYVEQHPGAPTWKSGSLRYLLGRRLARENRFPEAMAFLPPPYDKYVEKYVQALKDGSNEKLPKAQRARAWFTAAWLARHDGMEMMGTEVSPDGFITEGNFPDPNIAKERLAGTYRETRYVDQKSVTTTASIVPKPSKQERQRITQNRIRPDVRFHYRVIAAELAMRAAALLDDNTDELADVINRAGLWVKDRDEKVADRDFHILMRRAPKTTLGKAAMERRWFVDEAGPWSREAQAAYEASHPPRAEDGA